MRFELLGPLFYGAITALSLSLGASREVEACSCLEDRQVRLLTATDRALPRNVQIRLNVPRDGVILPGMQPGENLVRLDELRIGLRQLPAGGEPKLSERRLPGGQGTLLLLLSPQTPLRARARYEVFMTRGKQRHVLGQLQIGDSEDHTAPNLAPPEKSIYVAEHHDRYHNGSCQTGDATMTLQLAPVVENVDKKAVLYSIWIAKDAAAFDFQKPPTHTLIVTPDRNWIQLGVSHICGRGLNWHPEQNQTDLRVGIIAYDEAGNASSPVEHNAALRSN